ncbi:MAG: type II toxin-antitoxin system death-on-curing family toxin [Puniceicoccales bacterium]|jgi:death-on-curing protein|nr:type II toxin-antitoxin system death-on-curing family toxin [Puniceicoccales bacterium]
MTDFKYLEVCAVLAIHQNVIENSGGMFGLRDENLLISAMQRPKNLSNYCPDADIFELSASLIGGITANHPFFDGNKRTAILCGLTFLSINKLTIRKLNTNDAHRLMIDLATHKISEIQLSIFLRNLAIADKKNIGTTPV